MNDEVSRSRPIRMCYYMQTHAKLAQMARLVRLIREGSPDSIILIDHHASASTVDAAILGSLPGVHVFNGEGGYGDWSHLERYFAAVDWLDAHGVEYDWFQNLTAQDYPLRPIGDIEKMVADGGYDGYLQYAPAFPERTPPDADWGAGPDYRPCQPFDARQRFEYAHRFFGLPTPAKQRLLRPFMIVNRVQPWFQVALAFSAAGIRRKSTIFSDDFIAYGGSFFCALTPRCVRYARDFARENPDVVKFFRSALAPEESFLQTVLVNSGKFRLAPEGTHYVDFTNSRYNHPKVLGVADLPALMASDAHWARKFDPHVDSEVLDILDRHVRRES